MKRRQVDKILKRAERDAASWNRRNPIGTTVYQLARTGETISVARVLGGCARVQIADGDDLWYDLRNLRTYRNIAGRIR